MHEKNKGVTLVEVLLVMTIIVILATMMTGAINPIALVGRANDSRRKKDLGRIRVSFEDYYNDKNCYPTQDVVDGLMNENNCNGGVFLPWMNFWPCDPVSRQPYNIVVDGDDTGCPDWFKIYTDLENELDKDIPDGWHVDQYYHVGDGGLGVDDVNYGTSSTNVNWYDYVLSDDCNGVCKRKTGPDGCDEVPFCSGDACYVGVGCPAKCQVSSCGS